MTSRWLWVGCFGTMLGAGACRDEASEPASGDPLPVSSAPEGEAPEGEAPAKPDSAAPVEPDPAPAPPVPSGHGVARVGGAFYSSATGTTAIAVPELASVGTPGVTIDIVGEEHGRLVVETLGGAAGQHHCAGELPGLAHVRLRLYVDPSDLLEITTAPVEHAFADGTKIALSPGVPLVAVAGVDGSVRNAEAAGASVTLPVPEASRGTFCEPGEPRARDGALGKIYAGDPPSPLRYHERIVLEEASLYHDEAELAHYGVTSKDGDAFVTVRNACMEAVVRTSPSRLSLAPEPAHEPEFAGVLGVMGGEGSHGLGAAFGEDPEPWGSGLFGAPIGGTAGGTLGMRGTGGFGLAGSVPTPVEAVHTASVGAAVHWEDGTVAGQVLAARDLDGPARDVDGRKCFSVHLVPGRDAALSLCFAPGDLTEKEAVAVGVGKGAFALIGSSDDESESESESEGGVALGGRSKHVPRVHRAKDAEVKGGLDKNAIRRVVRAHLNEVRYCYNQLLVKEPTAKGKVTVGFTIGPDGKVSAASVTLDTMSSENVGRCIEKAIKRWMFPKPTGGASVTVSYPFVLEPGP